MGTLFEQPTQAQIRPKSKYFCAHQIANDKTIILSTENVQKVHPRPKLWGFEKRCRKIGWNALMVALFEQLPQTYIRPKSNYFFVHWIASERTIILSTENVQKVLSGPKLWGFEKISQNLLTVPLFKQLSRAQIGPKCKNFCDHRKANDQTIILSSENVQKVHCRPELWGFEKSCPEIVH